MVWLSGTALLLEGSNPERLLFQLFFRLNALYAVIKYSIREGLTLSTGVNKAVPHRSSNPMVWVL